MENRPYKELLMSSARLLIEDVKGVAVVTFNDTSVVDAQHIEDIRRQLMELVAQKNKTRVVLDMSRVSHLSSTALGVLIPLGQKAKELKGGLVLCGVQPPIRKLFKITKLEKQFRFCDDETEALADFNVMVD
jgi:anti-sigma B factor antagonist